MNLDDAVKAHSAWKTHLSQYLAHPDGSLKAAQVERDDACELGKWIVGDGGRQNGARPEFATLRAQHTAFHHAAATVIREADSGQNVSDEIALGSHSPYGTASTNCVSAIMALKRVTVSA